MNTSHTIKKAEQEIHYLANQIHQLESEMQFSRLVKIVFMNSLPKKYENICQLLKFHIKVLNQMIESLFAAEVYMKGENKNLYEINIVIKSARRFKAK